MKLISACFFLATVISLGQDGNTVDSVSQHMESCPPNEVRLVYFLHDKIGIRMVMTINLSKYSVYTARETDRAVQSDKTRELSHSQIEKINNLLRELPDFAEHTADTKTLFVAFWLDGKLCIRKYSRHSPPSPIDRLYDIGGGYLDVEDRKVEPSSTPNSLQPAASGRG